jgi:hypothetical protein
MSFKKTKTPWLVVCKRTIPTERPPLDGEVSANFLQIEGVAWSAQRIPAAGNLSFQDRSRYFFIQVGSSIILTRLSGPRSRPTSSQKIW